MTLAAVEAPRLAALVPLLREVGDAKRVRVAGRPGSLAEQAFLRAWGRLVEGEDATCVALSETAAALARARLAGVDAAVLVGSGLSSQDAHDIVARAVREVAGPVDPALLDRLLAALPRLREPGTPAPRVARDLVAQPRAGATAPGRPRVVVEPPESHGDHCLTVAVYAVLVAPACGAEPADAFLLGLAHHLHNACLPDAGFAGEVLLGNHLATVLDTLTERELQALPAPLAGRLRGLLAVREDLEHPVGRAFTTADVLDRVLQVHHHARAAAFTADQALDDLELVHAGPVQGYQLEVLARAGL